MKVSAKKVATECDDNAKKLDNELVTKKVNLKVDNQFDLKEIAPGTAPSCTERVLLTPVI